MTWSPLLCPHRGCQRAIGWFSLCVAAATPPCGTDPDLGSSLTFFPAQSVSDASACVTGQGGTHPPPAAPKMFKSATCSERLFLWWLFLPILTGWSRHRLPGGDNKVDKLLHCPPHFGVSSAKGLRWVSDPYRNTPDGLSRTKETQFSRISLERGLFSPPYRSVRSDYKPNPRSARVCQALRRLTEWAGFPPTRGRVTESPRSERHARS